MTYTPAQILERLEAIEKDLASRQNAYESSAREWIKGKRDREKARAVAFLKAKGTVAAREAEADAETCLIAAEHEAEYEAIRAVVRVLEARASIGQSLLRAQGRGA